MKKVLLALAVVATVACFSSCNKKCTCKTGIGTTTVEEEFDLDELNDKYNTDFKKCSDMTIAGVINCE